MSSITINNKEYKVKPTIRAMFIFEQITKKPFKIETMLDNYMYLYSLILANNLDDAIEWDEFINALDEDPTIYNQLNEVLSSSSKIDELLNDGSDEDSDEKKN